MLHELLAIALVLLFYPTNSDAFIEIVPAFESLSVGSAAARSFVDLEFVDCNNTFFLVDMDGFIYEFENDPDVTSATNPLNLPQVLGISETAFFDGTEAGLLGMTLHPEFCFNGYAFIRYTTSVADRTVAISRITFNFVTRFFSGILENVLTIENFPSSGGELFDNHYGGDMSFGIDRMFYIPVGDGGGQNNPSGSAQDASDLRGSILRIDVTTLPYTIPVGNPFIGDPTRRDEILFTGIRNSLTIDFSGENLFFTDGGLFASGDRFQEINFLPSLSLLTRNYGWPIFEGPECVDGGFFTELCNDTTGFTFPFYSYPAIGDMVSGTAVLGGFVYRGTMNPSLDGKYIFGDAITSFIGALEFNDTSVVSVEATQADFLVSGFARDRDGEVLILSRQQTGPGDSFIFALQPEIETNMTMAVCGNNITELGEECDNPSPCCSDQCLATALEEDCAGFSVCFTSFCTLQPRGVCMSTDMPKPVNESCVDPDTLCASRCDGTGICIPDDSCVPTQAPIPPTTNPPTTVPPTMTPTTVPPTAPSIAPTVVPTAAPTTSSPTTLAPTTLAPTTMPPTTMAPVAIPTSAPTTEAPTAPTMAPIPMEICDNPPITCEQDCVLGCNATEAHEVARENVQEQCNEACRRFSSRPCPDGLQVATLVDCVYNEWNVWDRRCDCGMAFDACIECSCSCNLSACI